jgi:hypothetical protein
MAVVYRPSMQRSAGQKHFTTTTGSDGGLMTHE